MEAKDEGREEGSIRREGTRPTPQHVGRGQSRRARTHRSTEKSFQNDRKERGRNRLAHIWLVFLRKLSKMFTHLFYHHSVEIILHYVKYVRQCVVSEEISGILRLTILITRNITYNIYLLKTGTMILISIVWP